jgi:hypothetical protein
LPLLRILHVIILLCFILNPHPYSDESPFNFLSSAPYLVCVCARAPPPLNPAPARHHHALSRHLRACTMTIDVPAMWSLVLAEHRQAGPCTTQALLSTRPSKQVRKPPQRPQGPRIRKDIHQTASTARVTMQATMRHVCKPPLLGLQKEEATAQPRGPFFYHTPLIHTLSILALRLNHLAGTWRTLLLSHLACSPTLLAPLVHCNKAHTRNLLDVRPVAGTRINPCLYIA